MSGGPGRAGLRIEGVCVDRLGQPVVRGVDLDAPAGEITVLLGANGAGKSTLLDGISGVAALRAGRISLDGVDITPRSRRGKVRAGLAYVQQGRSVFSGLTVEENLQVVGPPSRFCAALDLFPELRPRMDTKAALLSGGEQQMLVLGRALLQDPLVLMIDELSLGLAPSVIERMFEAVRRMSAHGLGVLLVEQFADRALAIGTRAAVLARGTVVMAGEAAELRAQPERLQAAYLSGSPARRAPADPMKPTRLTRPTRKERGTES